MSDGDLLPVPFEADSCHVAMDGESGVLFYEPCRDGCWLGMEDAVIAREYC